MRYYESECVDCGLPCLYESCPNYRVEHFVCDFCKEEDVTLYHFNGFEMCADCVLKRLDIVEGSDY